MRKNVPKRFDYGTMLILKKIRSENGKITAYDIRNWLASYKEERCDLSYGTVFGRLEELETQDFVRRKLAYGGRKNIYHWNPTEKGLKLLDTLEKVFEGEYVT